MVVCGWARIFLRQVAQEGVFCVCGVGSLGICENEATQRNKTRQAFDLRIAARASIARLPRLEVVVREGPKVAGGW